MLKFYPHAQNVHATYFLTFPECRFCPCSSGSYTAVATDRVHGHERATNTAVLIARTRSSTCVHGPYAAVETTLVHSRTIVYTAVYETCTRTVYTAVYTAAAVYVP